MQWGDNIRQNIHLINGGVYIASLKATEQQQNSFYGFKISRAYQICDRTLVGPKAYICIFP